MKRAKVSDSSAPTKKRRPALSPEARENQLISLAIDLVEQRLIDGTASSQETTHFLKLASSKAKRENELLETQIELAKAKTKAYQSTEKMEKLMSDALEAFKGYSGNGGYDDEY